MQKCNCFLCIDLIAYKLAELFLKFQLYNSVLSSLVTTFYIRSSDFFHLIAESLCPYQPSIFPAPQPLATTFLFYISEFHFEGVKISHYVLYFLVVISNGIFSLVSVSDIFIVGVQSCL